MATSLASVFVEGRIDTSRFGSDIRTGMASPTVSSNVDTAAKSAGSRFSSAFGNALKIGATLGAAFAVTKGAQFLKGTIEEAREAQKVANLTAAAIKSTGGAANVTAEQVASLSQRISEKAGVDDEAIQSGANLLLTFKNIRNEVGAGNAIFNRANKTVTDMSAALGQDTKSSAIQLGKALNDPIAGITALSRVGVTFTEQQKAQITALVESGDRLSAQKIILRELGTEFGGAAAAMADPMDKAKVAFSNLQEEIGAYLLPKLSAAATFFVERMIPGLRVFGSSIQDNVIPPLEVAGRFISQRVVPAFRALFSGGGDASGVISKLGGVVSEARRAFVSMWDSVRPIVQAVVTYVVKNWPAIRRTAGAVFGDVIDTVKSGLRLVAQVVRSVTDVIRGVWSRWGDRILAILKALWGTVADVLRGAFKIVRGIFDTATALLRGDWKEAWNGIKTILSGAWDVIKGVVRGALRVVVGILRLAWDVVKDGVSAAWGFVKDRISNNWNAIKAVLSGVGDFLRDKVVGAFRGAVDAIGTVWGKVKRIALAPINFMIGTVYMRGIKPLIEDVAGAVGLDLELPAVQKLARGGVIRGPETAHDSVYIHARPQESVMVPEFTRAVGGAVGVDRLNDMARRGALAGLRAVEGDPRFAGGFASGGTVDPDKRVYVDGEPLSAVHAAQLLIAGRLMGVRQSVMQGSWQPPTSYSGTSHTGPGVADTGPGNFKAQWAQRRAGIAAWARNIAGAASAGSGAHIHGVSLFSPGARSQPQRADYLNGGDGLGGSDYGPRPSLLPDLDKLLSRFLADGGSGGLLGSVVSGVLGAMPDWALKALGQVAKIKRGVTRAAGMAGDFSAAMSGGLGKVAGSLRDWITDQIANVGDYVNSSNLPLLAKQNQQTALDIMPGFGYGPWTSGDPWNALVELWTRESGWNHNAENPTSGAYGIPQALPPEKMAAIADDWATNAVTQIRWGLGYIRERYGNPVAALQFHDANNYYDRGGVAVGAGLLPKLTPAPERVLDPRTTRNFERFTHALDRPQRPLRFELDIGGGNVLTGVIRDESRQVARSEITEHAAFNDSIYLSHGISK